MYQNNFPTRAAEALYERSKAENKLKRIAEELTFYIDCKDCPMKDRCSKGLACAKTLYKWLKEI